LDVLVDFIAEIEKGSQVIFLYHTAGIQNNDVITFNADVLREGPSEEFSDNGVTAVLALLMKAKKIIRHM